jgi:hypothetical protein
MAQAAAEIIQDYHRHMNEDKLNDMLNGHDIAALQLPEGLVLRDVDTRHLALPFPARAILPTMRLIFTEMKDQVRFALSDKQVNSIATGTFQIKTLLTSRRRLHQTPHQPSQAGHKPSNPSPALHRTRQNCIPG